jgi:hypothetical protein
VNLNDGVWVWFVLVIVTGWFLPAFIRWARDFLSLCIEAMAELTAQWKEKFPD